MTQSAGTRQHAWPGVYVEGRFRGTGVGIVLDDATGDYDVAVDGRTVATLPRHRHPARSRRAPLHDVVTHGRHRPRTA